MNYNYTFAFEKLSCWKESRILVKHIYSITSQFPKHEIFGLVSQMRRAASSISSNLAEGTGRSSRKDQGHFYQMAYSSSLELLNHFYTALDLEYLEQNAFVEIRNKICSLSFKINSLRKTRFPSTS